MVQISDKLIRKASKQYDPEIVRVLHLERLSITSITNLDKCINLIDLSLAWNDLTNINGIEKLLTLERLNLSHNKITGLGDLKELAKLRYLDIRANHINDIDSIKTLSHCNSLTTLFMRSINGDDANIACQHPTYTNKVLKLIPHLSILDGGHVQLLTLSETMLSSFNESKPKNENKKEIIIEDWIDKNDLIITNYDINNDPIFKPAIDSYDKAMNLIKKDSVQILTKLESKIK